MQSGPQEPQPPSHGLRSLAFAIVTVAILIVAVAVLVVAWQFLGAQTAG
jgi:hypothetical protein